MVNSLFARLGVVRFIRGLVCRRRFLKALSECERLNRTTSRKYVVLSVDRHPVIINKPTFKEQKRRGLWNENATWGNMLRRQVTKENV